MTTSEMIAVMQAYEEGKEIEFRSKGSSAWHGANPKWNWAEYEYRVAPVKILRPYRDINEFLSDYCKRCNFPWHKGSTLLPIIWLQDKRTGEFSQITRYYKNGISLDGTLHNFVDAFNNYCYLDGKPFGEWGI